jgi:type IV secretion system protein VirB6
MSLDVFAAISSQFDPALTTAATNVVSNAIAQNAVVLGSALTLYVIVWGMLAAFGQVSLASLMQAAGRAAAVSSLMTAAFFLPYIQTPFLTTIPNWIATVTTGAAGAPAVAEQFSQLLSATQHMEAQIYQQASGLFYIASRIQAGLITMGICMLLVIDFFIWEIARWMMDVLVCIGPFILWLYLFRATRGVPERWFGKMVGVLVLYVLANVTMQIVISADMSFMLAAQSAGDGVDLQIASLLECFVFDMFGTAMLIMCPVIASYIGGGVGLPTAQIAQVTRVMSRVVTRGQP